MSLPLDETHSLTLTALEELEGVLCAMSKDPLRWSVKTDHLHLIPTLNGIALPTSYGLVDRKASGSSSQRVRTNSTVLMNPFEGLESIR